jgi:transposase
MAKDITMTDSVTIGLDLGDKWSEAAIVDARGDVVERVRARTTRAGFAKAFAGYEGCRLILEVGTHSPWVSRVLVERGFDVIVANPRRVRLIAQGDAKTDAFDAELLARLGRVDPNLLSPIVHRGEAAQRDLVLIRSREGLVRSRTQLVNQVRGFAKSLGLRLPKCTTRGFPKRVAEAAEHELFPGCAVLLEMIDRLNGEIRRMDREIERLCREQYPETQRLRQVMGVGPITALCFVLTLEDPGRFATSRSVGAYLGLRPRIRNSGSQEPQLGITKGGDVLLRRYLVTSAHYVLGPFGPDTDLRRFGQRLSERGGKAAKKRAVVAVARKLAVLLHRLWVSGEDYEPLGYAELKRSHAA